MSQTHSHDERVDGPGATPPPSGAPGKRTLTAQLARRAAERNPRMHARLGFDAAAFSSAPIDSEEFAHAVAAKQAERSLQVDGVVGARTHRAVVGAADAFDFTAGGGATRGKGKGKRTRKGTRDDARPGAASTRVVRGEITNIADEELGATVTINIGQEDGADGEATFRVLRPDGRPMGEGALQTLRIHRRSTEVHSRMKTLQLQGALVEATLTIPEPEPEADGAATPNADGSFGDQHDDRLEA